MSDREHGSTLTSKLLENNKSSLQRYRDLVLGEDGLFPLVRYELITFLLTSMPGAFGLGLRKIFFPRLLGKVGKNVIFGRNITIRHGYKIEIGDNVIIDDNVLLDAKGDSNRGIEIGNNSMISRNCILSCKGGDITFGNNCAFGINGLVHAIEGSNVTVGNDVVIAAYCYLVGGGTYNSEELDVPFKQQGDMSKGGVLIKDNVWIGSHVQVLDGVTIGTGCIIGAGAVVNRSVADYAVSAGVPAKTIKTRQ